MENMKVIVVFYNGVSVCVFDSVNKQWIQTNISFSSNFTQTISFGNGSADLLNVCVSTTNNTKAATFEHRWKHNNTSYYFQINFKLKLVLFWKIFLANKPILYFLDSKDHVQVPIPSYGLVVVQILLSRFWAEIYCCTKTNNNII